MDLLATAVDSIVEVERLIASATAWRARLIDSSTELALVAERIAGDGNGPQPWSVEERARRSLSAELATALRMPERTIGQLVFESQAIVRELPETLAALRAGDISYRHAQRIIDHALSLPAESRDQFEREVLPIARTHSVTKLDRRARSIREHLHPCSLSERHGTAHADRYVAVQPARDGMAWLTAYLSLADAEACDDRLTSVAADGADARTLAQRRADALVELATRGVTANGFGAGVRASVSITVPVLTMMGESSEPGHLAGRGPIDADTARRLAGTATSWTRILTHPETGAVLSVGRDSYAVPADLKRWLAMRDETCRFPGCGQSAFRCDIDHSEAWADDGETAHDNLAHLCRGHHRLKHQTAWRLEHLEHGILRWTSPVGKIYTTDPADGVAA